jgi:branched-chain amino acid transport system substrate-binding protein
MDSGLTKMALIHVNNDFGLNLAREFSAAYTKLGGVITSTTPYNENQPNYGAEVTAAMAGDPESLYLISYPVDGATVARAWISQGGPQKFLLNDGMNSTDFITAVGAEFLEGAYGTSSGTTETASTKYFYDNYAAVSGGIDPSAPAADRSYDAGAIVGLAVAKAGKADATAIRDAIRSVVDPAGEVIFAGPEEFKKALALIAEGKAINYQGVIGNVQFDEFGDISGPFRLWQIKGGEVVTAGQMTAEDVIATKAAMK